jgi:exonuclease VII large subunit
MAGLIVGYSNSSRQSLIETSRILNERLYTIFDNEIKYLKDSKNLLEALNPLDILKRGYAIVRKGGRFVNPKLINTGDNLTIETYSSNISVTVNNLSLKDNL